MKYNQLLQFIVVFGIASCVRSRELLATAPCSVKQCSSCSTRNPDICNVCAENYALQYDGRCADRCQEGFYWVRNATAKASTCKACPSGQACAGGTESTAVPRTCAANSTPNVARTACGECVSPKISLRPGHLEGALHCPCQLQHGAPQTACSHMIREI